ncbi:hypothetical protein [Polaromonas sp.]|uniref:hypothetical protein n=1 Tax=Polaromonas sp. TaxID=1869339 RepID=UPI003565AC62
MLKDNRPAIVFNYLKAFGNQIFRLLTLVTLSTPHCHHKAAGRAYDGRITANKEFIMASAQYRIESRNSLQHSLLPLATFRSLYADRSLAVAVAVKSVGDPTCQEIRVVHIPSGEVVFQTSFISH